MLLQNGAIHFKNILEHQKNCATFSTLSTFLYFVPKYIKTEELSEIAADPDLQVMK